VLGDHSQIVGDYAPADPSVHALVAMVAAAAQAMPPFEPADAPFDAGAPVSSLAEPALLLVCPARRRLSSRARQYDSLNPSLLRRLFIGWGRQLAVASK
jgi:hypothetical protein